MKKEKLNQTRPIFIRMLSMITLSVVVTTLIVSLLLYSSFQSFALQLVHDYAQNDLAKMGDKLVTKLAQVKTLASNVYFDTEISKLYLYDEVDVRDVSVALQRMSFYLSASSMIDSIYVYNAETEMFYTTTNNRVVARADFADQDVMRLLDDQESLREVPIVYRTTEVQSQGFLGGTIYSCVFSDMSGSKAARDAIVINIKADVILDILKSGDERIRNDALYIDSVSRRFVSLTDQKMSFPEQDMGMLMDEGNDRGQFFTDIDDQRQMVSYWKITSGVQLVLLNVAPASIVTQDIDRMRRNTLVFVLLALLASFGFIFYLSNVLYKPISTVLTRAREMENRENRNLYGFKNTFFQNVAWGRSEYTAPVLLEYGKDIGLAIEAFAEIEAIVFKVDGYAGFCIEHDVSDRNLYKQRFINVARELMRTIGPCEVVDMGDDVFMQVHNRSPQAMDRQEICDYVRKVQLAVKEAYSVSLTVAVSDPGMGLGSLKTLFHSAVDMTKQKLWVGNGCIFFSDSRARKDDAAYRYPLAKERILEEGLRLGRTSDAIKSFNALLWSAEDYSFSVYQSVITAAAVIVSRTVAQMPEGSIPTRAKDSFHIIREAEACETADEVGEYFLQLFQSIREYANDTKQNKHQMVVEQAMKIIQEDYRDCNLCLNSIAERISLSPAYLGKIFKTATAMAIADYINYVRLEKAKILLKETQDTIQDIMQATGFLSSGYFYTQFKKVNAMTPREYRQELGKQNHQKM